MSLSTLNPDPSSLGELLIHPQAELHSLQLVTGIEGDPCSSAPAALAREPVSFLSTTPVTGATPAHCHDAQRLAVLQLCLCLQIMFIPHAFAQRQTSWTLMKAQ